MFLTVQRPFFLSYTSVNRRLRSVKHVHLLYSPLFKTLITGVGEAADGLAAVAGVVVEGAVVVLVVVMVVVDRTVVAPSVLAVVSAAVVVIGGDVVV